MKTMKFTPDEPIDVNGEIYTELMFERCNAGHLAETDLATGSVAKSIALYAAMAGVPVGVIRRMDVDDFARVAVETAPLMGKSAQALIEKLVEEDQPEEGVAASA